MPSHQWLQPRRTALGAAHRDLRPGRRGRRGHRPLRPGCPDHRPRPQRHRTAELGPTRIGAIAEAAFVLLHREDHPPIRRLNDGQLPGAVETTPRGLLAGLLMATGDDRPRGMKAAAARR